jgi:hypothetical protein
MFICFCPVYSKVPLVRNRQKIKIISPSFQIKYDILFPPFFFFYTILNPMYNGEDKSLLEASTVIVLVVEFVFIQFKNESFFTISYKLYQIKEFLAFLI